MTVGYRGHPVTASGTKTPDQEGADQVVGAIHSVLVNGKGQRDEFFEQVDAMLPENMIHCHEFSEAFCMGEEPLTISNRFYHEIRCEGSHVYRLL